MLRGKTAAQWAGVRDEGGEVRDETEKDGRKGMLPDPI